MYNVQFSRKYSDTFTISKDINVDITLRSTSDGVTTDLTPSSRRNLRSAHRNLATSETYTVTDVDSIEIYYGANAELSSSTLTFSSTSDSDETESSSSGGSSGMIGVIIAV